ncbi:MFS transporter [Rhodococcus sp. ACPA4]|uniref:MFS transporter n=1 Tax=Rhodococcus sp. ACPA4 TaxID=2028571 RepID=UPI000BB13768|nr:MFS transporter [Rhodococcus sp. ACPA4]PBC35834.1 MFS transporter [Rhodococcus sp. ACPA4]
MADSSLFGNPPPSSAETEAVYKRVSRRLIAFLFVCYAAAYLDRVNVGFAKLQMLEDLQFSEAVYGLGAGMFFVGYILFEVPSNIILQKVGPKIWIARIMLTWALISGSMAFVTSPEMFYALRFLLGVAEAGFIPGILFYLTQWFPVHRRGRVFALFLSAIPVASIFGGPLSGWLLQSFNGAAGLHGWQWVFLIEAIPSLILGFAVLKWLDNSYTDAKWLTLRQKQVIEHTLASEALTEDTATHNRVFDVLKSPKVWLLSAIYFCIALGIYVIGFWIPTIISDSGVAGGIAIGLLTAIPYLAAVVAMIANSTHADKHGERRWHTSLPCWVTAAGLVLTGLGAHNTTVAMIGLVIAAAGASTAQAAFWSLPAAFLTGIGAATGIALINSVGNISGVVSTSAVGWLSSITGTTTISLYAVALLLVTGGALILMIPARLLDDQRHLDRGDPSETTVSHPVVTHPRSGQSVPPQPHQTKSPLPTEKDTIA